jgi:hypothetical protein
MKKISQTRQKNLITTGVKCAVDLREVASARGIPGADDFIMGLIYGSLLLEQCLPGKGDLIDSYGNALRQPEDVFQSTAFLELGCRIGAREATAIDGSSQQHQFELAQVIEARMIAVANRLGINKEELMLVLSIAILVAIEACVTTGHSKSLQIVALERFPYIRETTKELIEVRKRQATAQST